MGKEQTGGVDTVKLPVFFKKRGRFREDAGYVYPSALAAIVIFFTIALDVIFENRSTYSNQYLTFGIGISGSLYILIQSVWVFPRLQKLRSLYIWANAIVSAIGLSLLALVLDDAHHTFYSILLILTVTSITIISGRKPTYLLILLSGSIYFLAHKNEISGLLDWSAHILPLIAAVVITETILLLKQATQRQIRSLETINTFSQHISASLETDQVLSLLNAALQKALTADSYYVGLVDSDVIRLDLFYDDGEYYTDTEISINNTLAGWVVRNQSGLFLPDLSDGIPIADVQRTLVGNKRPSSSWIGVPMRTVHINGLLAVSSYKANAFRHTDMELLSNLAQHAALALDNTVHHKQVEQQSRLDSLTGTYNHRYFLQALQEQIDDAHIQKKVISLIMLDIDFFKRYNDSFGHQVGDLVLIKLCETIQQNTKKDDFVGRWGGEEFVVALPGARGDEAYQVAKRIQKTMQELILSHPKHEKIPAPTVSQGISVYPDEANEIDRFIYLADQRLYRAKERGRNQIEPDPSHWETIQSAKKVHRV